GTLITSSRGKEKGIDIPDRLVTGIANIDDISQIDVKIDNQDIEKQALVFEKMAEAYNSVDFIIFYFSNVIYTVSTDFLDDEIRIFKEEGLELIVTENCAKVSAVGAGMAGIPGVASKITSALVNNKVEILQSADSHTTIWVLLHDKHIKTALNALHDAFDLSHQYEKERSV